MSRCMSSDSLSPTAELAREQGVAVKSEPPNTPNYTSPGAPGSPTPARTLHQEIRTSRRTGGMQATSCILLQTQPLAGASHPKK